MSFRGNISRIHLNFVQFESRELSMDSGRRPERCGLSLLRRLPTPRVAVQQGPQPLYERRSFFAHQENLHRSMFLRKQSVDDQRGVDVSTPPGRHGEHLDYGVVVEALLGDRRIKIA